MLDKRSTPKEREHSKQANREAGRAMDYRTEPLETILNVRTGETTVELRGAIDRTARKAA